MKRFCTKYHLVWSVVKIQAALFEWNLSARWLKAQWPYKFTATTLWRGSINLYTASTFIWVACTKITPSEMWATAHMQKWNISSLDPLSMIFFFFFFFLLFHSLKNLCWIFVPLHYMCTWSNSEWWHRSAKTVKPTLGFILCFHFKDGYEWQVL